MVIRHIAGCARSLKVLLRSCSMLRNVFCRESSPCRNRHTNWIEEQICRSTSGGDSRVGAKREIFSRRRINRLDRLATSSDSTLSRDHKTQSAAKRIFFGSQRPERFTRLLIENLEARHVLSGGLWLVQIDGLPDSSDDERIEAAETLFHDAGLSDDQVLAVAVVDPFESILIQTPIDTTEDAVNDELQSLPGFVSVEEYSPELTPAEQEEDEEEELESLIDPNAPELTEEVIGANINVALNGNEPTIAVNPTNSNNVIVAQFNNGLQSLKISTDGGATFPIQRNGVLPSGQTFFQGDDSLAFDSAGRLFWTYLTGGTPSGPNVTVQQINPTTGALVGSAVLVATSNLDKEWIAADKNAASPFHDNLYVIWHD